MRCCCAVVLVLLIACGNVAGLVFARGAARRREIGKRVRLSFIEDNPWHTIVGVVATARYREITRPRFDIYVAMRQSTSDVKHFTVRTTGDPLSASGAVGAAITHVDPRLAIDGVTTMDAIVRGVRGPWLIVFAIFGLIALALAVVGLFAVVSYAVTRRSREIGVRLALGATPGRVVKLMITQAAGPAAIGLIAGAAASRALSGAVQPLLFDVRAGDPFVLALVVLFFALVIVTASYVPARRAGRVDPQLALRHE